MDVAARYRHLLKVVEPESGHTDNEREIAQMVIDKLRATYGDSLLVADAQEVATSSVVLKCKEPWMRTLAIHIANFLGCTPYKVGAIRTYRHNVQNMGEAEWDCEGDYRTYTRWRKDRVKVEGPSPMVDIIESLYTEQRKRFAGIIDVTVNGMMWGSMPYEVDSDGNAVDPPPLTDEEREALRTAYAIGQRGRVTPPNRLLAAPEDNS
ncbi:MAG: hypothetical protein CMB99_01215 [Flavobacteriaceae bacterium]|nr:hypothetical protein [Flavobacteriaceae bacterium]|tara:strand:+ start:5623 stop:6246 length:624 start_codon:yes stop_codon:yes gene_type:complete